MLTYFTAHISHQVDRSRSSSSSHLPPPQSLSSQCRSFCKVDSFVRILMRRAQDEEEKQKKLVLINWLFEAADFFCCIQQSAFQHSFFYEILVSRSATVFFPGDCELGSNAGRSKATTHKNKNVVGNGLKRRRCYEAIDEEATRGSIAAQWLPARVGCCCNVFSMWFQAKTDPKLQVRRFKAWGRKAFCSSEEDQGSLQ